MYPAAAVAAAAAAGTAVVAGVMVSCCGLSHLSGASSSGSTNTGGSMGGHARPTHSVGAGSEKQEGGEVELTGTPWLEAKAWMLLQAAGKRVVGQESQHQPWPATWQREAVGWED